MQHIQNASATLMSSEGTLYHLDLKRRDGVPPNLVLVGASDRVDAIARHFDEVVFVHTNTARPEFHSVFGVYQGSPVGAISVGIGTPSMEIVCNELHALFEYDPHHDRWEKPSAPIHIIRLGTAGASRADIPLGAYAITRFSVGLDNAGIYYPPVPQDPESASLEAHLQHTLFGVVNPCLYATPAHPRVVSTLVKMASRQSSVPVVEGITTSSPGFFAAEGRTVGRLHTAFTLPEFMKAVEEFSFQDLHIVNHEMETSILLRMMHEQLRYEVGALCIILDNLRTNEIIAPALYQRRMDDAIVVVLDSLAYLASHT